MYKTEFVNEVAKKANMSQANAKAAVDAMTDVITDALKKGDKVALVGFGTFEARHRAARMGKNPQTGESIKIPATTAPAFKVGKKFKDAVSKKKKK